jgi:hypothetical protein
MSITHPHGHQGQIPPVAIEYFTLVGVDVTSFYGAHPLITQVFIPEKGWRRHGFNKRVSQHWLRKLRAEGVTHVTLSVGGYNPDFSVAELLRSWR